MFQLIILFFVSLYAYFVNTAESEDDKEGKRPRHDARGDKRGDKSCFEFTVSESGHLKAAEGRASGTNHHEQHPSNVEATIGVLEDDDSVLPGCCTSTTTNATLSRSQATDINFDLAKPNSDESITGPVSLANSLDSMTQSTNTASDATDTSRADKNLSAANVLPENGLKFPPKVEDVLRVFLDWMENQLQRQYGQKEAKPLLAFFHYLWKSLVSIREYVD